MKLFSLHLGREVPIYAFCGILAAKVNLLKAIPSAETGIWPDGKLLNDVSSTERLVPPDGKRLRG